MFLISIDTHSTQKKWEEAEGRGLKERTQNSKSVVVILFVELLTFFSVQQIDIALVNCAKFE